MNYLPKLNGPHVTEATQIRNNILRFLHHASYIIIPEVQYKIMSVVNFVQTRDTTEWFLNHQYITRDCHSSLMAIYKIGKENNLF